MTIPAMMNVVEITEFGLTGGLRLSERVVPEPGDGEVLVQVAGAGINRADLMQRQGSYPPPPGASDILGLEVSGTVVALGSGVSGWVVGQKVCALLTGGGYAEYCAVPALQCLTIPDGVELVEAAALPEACFTVWTNVFERGRLSKGETFLMHGGSSGIGTTAIQLAKLFGVRVFTTAGSAEKCAACERLGAERAINYRTEDFVAVLKDVTEGRGVDVILDIVGGAYLQRNLDSLALEGRLVLIALMGGAKAEVNLAALMSRRSILTGSTLRSRSVEQKAAIAAAVRGRVWPHIAARRFQPVIHAKYPLCEAAEAHRVMEASTHIGKLLLVTSDSR